MLFWGELFEIQNFRVTQVLKISDLENQNFNLRGGRRGVDLNPKPIKAVYLTQSPSLVIDVNQCFWHRNCSPDFLFQSIEFINGKLKVSKILDRK